MTITDLGIVMPAKQLHHGKAREISLPNGLGMPPQDAGIAIFPAHRLPESVTGIRNGSLLSVASVIDRRRAWHRVLPWNFVFRFLVGFLSPTNTPNLTNGQQNAQASWHEFPPPTHPATFFALQNFSLAGKCWKFSTTNLFFFFSDDGYSWGWGVNFSPILWTKSFLWGLCQASFFFKPAVLRVEEPVA